MIKYTYILILFLFGCSPLFSQVNQKSTRVTEFRRTVEIKGSVKGRENLEPIEGVEVSTTLGEYTLTNSQGDYKIKVAIGDELIFSSPQFETKRYTVRSDEDVDVRVEGYSRNGSSRTVGRNQASMHQSYLDSAYSYRKTNIEKSIDFITQSIAQLGKRGNKKELARFLENIPDKTDALWMLNSHFLIKNTDLFVASAIKNKLPSGSSTSQVDGGVMVTYGQNAFRTGQLAAGLAHKILQGNSPAGLPVEITDFFLGINLKTADMIGIDISDDILHVADTIIRP